MCCFCWLLVGLNDFSSRCEDVIDVGDVVLVVVLLVVSIFGVVLTVEVFIVLVGFTKTGLLVLP